MNDPDIEKALQVLKDVPAVPQDRREAAFERVRAEWRAGLAEREMAARAVPSRRWMLATAASVALALVTALGFWFTRDTESIIVAATISAVHGEGSFRMNQEIHTNEIIKTESTTLAVTLPSGLVMRMAPGSELAFRDGSHLELAKGRLYVDSNAIRDPDPLVIETALGDVQHLGTRYFVDYDRQRLAVAVRDGKISVHESRAVQPLATAGAGEQLSILAASPGQVERVAMAVADRSWNWIEVVPTRLEIDGLMLGAFLQWYESETGRRVVLDNIDSETLLHGSIDGLTPDDALDAIAVAVEIDVDRRNDQVIMRKP